MQRTEPGRETEAKAVDLRPWRIMRQWYGVAPALLCRRHLLGDHVEAHMAVGHMKRGRKLGRLQTKGFIDPTWLWSRHEDVAAEMLLRGYRHNSPLNWYLTPREPLQHAHMERDRQDLISRCPECRERIENARKGGG